MFHLFVFLKTTFRTVESNASLLYYLGKVERVVVNVSSENLLKKD